MLQEAACTWKATCCHDFNRAALMAVARNELLSGHGLLVTVRLHNCTACQMGKRHCACKTASVRTSEFPASRDASWPSKLHKESSTSSQKLTRRRIRHHCQQACYNIPALFRSINGHASNWPLSRPSQQLSLPGKRTCKIATSHAQGGPQSNETKRGSSQ